MRAISLKTISVFIVMQIATMMTGFVAASRVYRIDVLDQFAAILSLIAAGGVYLASNLLLMRLAVQPGLLQDGAMKPGSAAEQRWNIWILSLLFVGYPLIRTKALPLFIQGLVYRALGAKWGRNTFCSGVVLDPPHVAIGDNTLLGQSCIIYAHVIEGDRLELWRVQIGSGVTIGANAVIMPGVKIGDGAIVAAGAVVTKGTKIQPGEVWGGVPARRIRSAHVGAHELNSAA